MSKGDEAAPQQQSCPRWVYGIGERERKKLVLVPDDIVG